MNRESISGALVGDQALEESYCCNCAEWYAIQTRYRFEKKVTVSLQRKGMDTFIPLFAEVHRWSDRDKAIQTPLFSGYTFARLAITAELKRTVLQTAGVIGFIGSSGELTPVPSQQIDNLRTLLSHHLPCALSPFLNIGQRVRVRGGSLDGLEGILERNDVNRLVVSIDCIQRSIAFRIEGYELEPI